MEVLLVHPGGPYWARRDDGAWSLPKGEPLPGEELLTAACREVREETGFVFEGPFRPLPPVRQAGGKLVHAWLVEGDADPGSLESNSFLAEWPPRSGRMREFPEVDRAGWFALSEARRRILPSQVPLLDALETVLGRQGHEPPAGQALSRRSSETGKSSRAR